MSWPPAYREDAPCPDDGCKYRPEVTEAPAGLYADDDIICVHCGWSVAQRASASAANIIDNDGHIRDCGNGGSDPSDCSPACAQANARAAKSEGRQMSYACNGCGRAFEPMGSTVGLFCAECRPITAETVTDADIKEAIAVLDTELGILHAALRIKTGKLVEMMREGAADAISARCLAEVLDARAAKGPR